METEKYIIKIGKESPESNYSYNSRMVEANDLKGSHLINLLSNTLESGFPREFVIEQYNSGFFSDEVSEAIDGLIKVYKSIRSKTCF